MIQKLDISILSDISIIRQMAVAVAACDVKTASNGKAYLNLTLSDGVSQLSAKKWDFTGQPPKVGTVIVIDGSCGSYKGVLQAVVERWRNITTEDGIDVNEFVASSQIPVSELWDTAHKYMSFIKDPVIHNLVHCIYDLYKDDIIQAPAALHHHHAYRGGLLEHSNAVTRTALTMCDETINISLLIAGCLLHDIGKIKTYKMGLVIEMTDEGQLLDHIVLGNNIIYLTGAAIGTDLAVITLLQHMISSHHGKLEYGSPIVPKLSEALILHQADVANVNLTKATALRYSTDSDSNWSSYDRSFGSNILVPKNGVYVLSTTPTYNHFFVEPQHTESEEAK